MLTIKKMIMVTGLAMLPMIAMAEDKVVSMNINAAVFGTNAAKAQMEKLQKDPEYVATKAKLDGAKADMTGLQASFQKDGMSWSAEKKAETEKKMQSLTQDYQFQLKKLQQQQQETMQQVMQQLSPKLESIIKDMVKAEGITMIVDSQSVIIAKPENDYTAKLTAALNNVK